MFFPILNLWLINEYGWQRAWQILGVIVAGMIIVPSILFLRNRPEDLGLLPDGVASGASLASASRTSDVPTNEAWPLSEVLRDTTFWKLLSAGVCSGMIGTGLVFHQETILAAHGISKTLAMSLITFQALIGTVAAIAAGSLTDRYPAGKLLATAMLMLGLRVGIVCFMPVWWLVFGYAILNGLHGAIQRTAGTVVWVNYYGRQNQGVIRGAAMSAMILAAAIGPLPLAMANDKWGTYTPAFIAFTIIPLLSMLLVLTAKQPVRDRRPSLPE